MEHYTWDDMQKEVLSPTIARKIISGDKAMVGLDAAPPRFAASLPISAIGEPG